MTHKATSNKASQQEINDIQLKVKNLESQIERVKTDIETHEELLK